MQSNDHMQASLALVLRLYRMDFVKNKCRLGTTRHPDAIEGLCVIRSE